MYFVNTTFVFNNIYHGNYFETDLIGGWFYVMQILFIQGIILIVTKTILLGLLSYISKKFVLVAASVLNELNLSITNVSVVLGYNYVLDE